MRRSLILLLTITVALVLAAPASAGKPNCVEPPYHPSCPSDDGAEELPAGGTVCDPATEANHDSWAPGSGDTFTVTLSGKDDGACIDVLTGERMVWTVDIGGSGARYVGVIPRDSIGPGDSCGGYLMRSESQIYTTHILGYDGTIPAATVNACGTDFAEWVDPGVVADDSCVAFESELCLVTEATGDPHPLVLQIFMRGNADGATTFTFAFEPVS